MARARTNKNVPAKGRLREMADRLWSKAVLSDWNHKCVVCKKKATDAHHLIPRANYATRYQTINGVALCARDHLWNVDCAPHSNAAGWLKFLQENHPHQYRWYTAEPRPVFTGTTNAAYFVEQIQELRQYVEEQQFEDIVGIRFNQYLLEQEAQS